MMHFRFSGKVGYGLHAQRGGLDLPREQLEGALKVEDRLRCDKVWQEKWAMFDTNEWRQQVCHELQLQALREVGVPEQALEKGLATLRSSRRRFQHDEDFYRPVYVRFDRAVLPALTYDSINEQFPHVPLIDPRTSLETSLEEALNLRIGGPLACGWHGTEWSAEMHPVFENGSVPVVILAGSIT
eukprot:TRINITY_DN10003_c0_g1_i1.p1 TRINITY_DN10003_c0_g1~~TRINITY_DN10003_c0_g1_i1.p1  ORF type:complete len:185 (-),score=9.85 TRINITY_DN10003_c0_g1_i1:565-1119(-)